MTREERTIYREKRRDIRSDAHY